MPTALRALLLAVVFTVLPVGVGVAMTGGHRGVPSSASPYVSTALGDYDTTTVTVARGAFCDRLPAAALTAALGRPPTYADAYTDGQRHSLGGPGRGDVLHEFGCTFRAGQVEARAWVFAPPVTRAWARGLAATTGKGCTQPAGTPAFGAPTSASVCGRSTRTATYRGLFGDAWLSCSLSAPGIAGSTLLDRAGRWCVAVARAASVG